MMNRKVLQAIQDQGLATSMLNSIEKNFTVSGEPIAYYDESESFASHPRP